MLKQKIKTKCRFPLLYYIIFTTGCLFKNLICIKKEQYFAQGLYEGGLITYMRTAIICQEDFKELAGKYY
jgi:hypothetical protein